MGNHIVLLDQSEAFDAWCRRREIGYDINIVGYEKHCCAMDGFRGGWNAALDAALKFVVIDGNPAIARERIEQLKVHPHPNFGDAD